IHAARLFRELSRALLSRDCGIFRSLVCGFASKVSPRGRARYSSEIVTVTRIGVNRRNTGFQPANLAGRMPARRDSQDGCATPCLAPAVVVSRQPTPDQDVNAAGPLAP